MFVSHNTLSLTRIPSLSLTHTLSLQTPPPQINVHVQIHVIDSYKRSSTPCDIIHNLTCTCTSPCRHIMHYLASTHNFDYRCRDNEWVNHYHTCIQDFCSGTCTCMCVHVHVHVHYTHVYNYTVHIYTMYSVVSVNFLCFVSVSRKWKCISYQNISKLLEVFFFISVHLEAPNTLVAMQQQRTTWVCTMYMYMYMKKK